MPKTNLKIIPGKAKSKIEDDVDDLFRAPLTEFISARKTLAATLKKEGRSVEADGVKALTKPSVSAWTVNQLYWSHRELFEQLIATGESIRQAQSGKTSRNLRAVLDERRELLAQLSDLATTILRDAGNNPALDTLRRIATTLEAMTAYATLPAGLSPGRLTRDVDPPGFDTFAPFAPEAGAAKRPAEPARVSKPSKPAAVVKPGPSAADARRLKQVRQAKLAAAKASVQKAKRSLVTARSTAKRLEAAQKKAGGEAKEAEQHRREAERRLNNATAASEAAGKKLQDIILEVELAKKSVEDATLAAERAASELESLFRES